MCEGVIQGTVSFPGEGLPEDIKVGAIDTLTNKTYYIKNWDSFGCFTLNVPIGVYYVFAETSDFRDTLHNTIKMKGYFTEFTKKGLDTSSGNASHKPLPVKINCNEIVKNIRVGDFWVD